jgi:hypothetical protein
VIHPLSDYRVPPADRQHRRVVPASEAQRGQRLPDEFRPWQDDSLDQRAVGIGLEIRVVVGCLRQEVDTFGVDQLQERLAVGPNEQDVTLSEFLAGQPRNLVLEHGT